MGSKFGFAQVKSNLKFVIFGFDPTLFTIKDLLSTGGQSINHPMALFRPKFSQCAIGGTIAFCIPRQLFYDHNPPKPLHGIAVAGWMD